MNDIYEVKNYSYELNPEMLKLIGEEFDADKITTKFANAVKGKSNEEIEAIGKEIFETYGRDWMKKCHKLGDEYSDRTYEILLETIDKTGGYYKFALLPQRFIEIAYLSTQEIAILPIVENNKDRLIYRMVDCQIFKNIKAKCGDEAANLLTCKNACITACETIHQDLEVDALIQQKAMMPKDNYCEFEAKRA